MDLLQTGLKKARASAWHLWLLNRGLWRLVPFNSPHRVRVTAITDDSITVAARNTKRNLNHIGGIHACLLATLCEYASGLRLLSGLPSGEYRIILKNIHMTYHYQAKKEVHVTFRLTEEELRQDICVPLETAEKLFREFAVEAYDSDNNHICTGLVNWQIKRWKNVKTAVR